MKALQTQCLQIDTELFQMKAECESRMEAVRRMNPNEAYGHNLPLDPSVSVTLHFSDRPEKNCITQS